MRVPAQAMEPLDTPQLLDHASRLVNSYRNVVPTDLAKQMKISPAKAAAVHEMYREWSTDPKRQTPAIDAFVGDIYSGLQTAVWSDADRVYAHEHLLILSGLYGALRACDGIMPYRLEMGYKLPNGISLYTYWSDAIAKLLPETTSLIVNLSAVEYTKAVLPYTDVPIIAPKFLTVNTQTGQPTFVTVHTKIARGAFAGWMIRNRIDDPTKLHEFTDLGYHYDPASSTDTQPVFICEEFGGLGLSIRLT